MKQTNKALSLVLGRDSIFWVLSWATVLFLLSLAVSPALAQGNAASPASAQAAPPDSVTATTAFNGWQPGLPLDMNELNSGDLCWRAETGLIPLPAVGTDVQLDLTGLMVHGTMTQSFVNPTGEVIEAVYLFPLPERAAVNYMEMRIGDRHIISVAKERKEAKKTYEKAKSKGKKAALIEQERPNLFTTSVANINPGETVDVQLEYVQELDYLDGTFSIAFPLTFTPRYIPFDALAIAAACNGMMAATPVSSAVPDAHRITPPFVESDGGKETVPSATIRVNLEPGFPVTNLTSTSHKVDVRQSGRRFKVSLAAGSTPADRDFLFSWEQKRGNRAIPAVFTEQREDGNYALIMIVPPRSKRGMQPQSQPTETMFIIDVSGSMSGPSIRMAREALSAAIGRLDRSDYFNIIAFNDKHWAYENRFIRADRTEKSRAQNWVSKLQADGGTEIHSALQTGLTLTGQGSSEHLRRIIFLTDGAVGNEAQVLASVMAGLGDIRIHTIGIGYAPNRYLMKKMAEGGRGYSTYVTANNDGANAIDDFFKRINRPVMTNLSLGWSDMEPLETYPARMPDLYAGEAIMASVRLSAGEELKGQAVLTGDLPSGQVHAPIVLGENPRQGSGIAARWARTKIASLMDDLTVGADPDQVRADVIEVALAHNMVTKYTSLVAVEKIVTASKPGKTGRVANVLPKGSQLLRAQGSLPSTGTFDPLLRLIGIAMLILGTIVGLSLRFWRLS